MPFHFLNIRIYLVENMFSLSFCHLPMVLFLLVLWVKCCLVACMIYFYVAKQMKTGGVVVWSNKDFLAVYRGCNYQSGSKHFRNIYHNSTSDQENSSSTVNYLNTTAVARVSSDGSSLDEMIHGTDGKWESLQMASLYEREADRLLDGLGPRFVDWWMQKPLPVDGDLLPELVPGFKTPFRLCPPFTRSKLIDAELTYLRKLARPLPTHFVLGNFFLLLLWNIILN